MPFKDLQRRRIYQREWQGRHSAAIDAGYRAAGRCPSCGRLDPLPSGQLKCDACKTVAAKWQRRLKERVIAAYGGKCQCCGEANPHFMTIDHTNNNGAEHRREIKNSLYKWLEKNGFPQDGFQLLCWNCNAGKRVNGGICPHKTMTPEVEPDGR
jgi:hypothetical protein